MAKTRPTIWTRTQFVTWLRDMKGAHIVTIRCRTVPEMRKKDADGNANPFYGFLHKISEVNCVVNFIYQNAVNRQLAREEKAAEFEAMPRIWGNRIMGTPLVEYKGNFYLEVKVNSTQHFYFRNDTKEEVDGALVKPFLPKKAASRQGVDKEVILRDYKVESVVGFLWEQKVYSIVED